MPTNQWGMIEKERSAEEILAELLSKSKAAGQEAGGRLGNAYESLTTPDMGERFGNFAHEYSGGPNSLMDTLGNAANIVKSRGENVVDSLMTPSGETPVGTVVREAKEGIEGLINPEPSMSERFGGLMESAKSGIQGMMEDKPQVNTQGRREGDVWVENGYMFRMTPEGVEYRRAE